MTTAQALSTGPDYNTIKTKQQIAWGTGNYALVGVTLQPVGERLAERLDVQAHQRVLDVAGGNGNAALACARHAADVTCTDYVPSLLTHAHQRADVDGLRMHFEVADVEALPFPDASFDIVTSTFGAMFAPNQEQTAREMFRVTQPGGKIGMANWTPDSFIGELFKTIGKHVPPAPGLNSPALWGTENRLAELFPEASSIEVKAKTFTLHAQSAEAWLQTWQTYYGPLNKAFEACPDSNQLAADLMELVGRFNRSDRAMAVDSSYLEIVITK